MQARCMGCFHAFTLRPAVRQTWDRLDVRSSRTAKSSDVGPLAAGRIDARDSALVRSQPSVNSTHPQRALGCSSAAEEALQIGIDAGCARRDLARSGGRPLTTLDCGDAGACALDHQPRDPAQRWTSRLPSQSGRLSRTRPLGRRSVVWRQQQLYRHVGGASDTLCDAG